MLCLVCGWQRDDQGEDHVLNRYWTRASTPRPESFREDLHNAMCAVSQPY